MSRSWLDRGRRALQAGEWSEARSAFEAALRQAQAPEAFEGLGAAAWWLDDTDGAIRARERAFKAYDERCDRIAAARVAIALGEDSLACLGAAAAAREWYRRSAELLDGVDAGPEHGWLELARGDLALETGGDPAVVRQHADAATALGRELGLIDLETPARALAGAAWVLEGSLQEGMRLLESSASAATSGRLQDPIAMGASLIYMVASCNRIRDYDRASQWCERAEELGRRIRFGTLLAVIHTHVAEGLIAHGDWERAERELEGALRFFAKSRPGMQPLAQVRLAALRRRQEWIEDARGILATIGDPARQGAFDQRLVSLEHAALALQVRDLPRAIEWADRFLREVGSARRMERLGGLEVLLRAHLQSRDLGSAGPVLVEMEALAQGDAPAAMAGAIRLGKGLALLARRDREAARPVLAAAVELLERGGAIYESTRARINLAASFPAADEDAQAIRELERAWRTLAKMGLPARPAPAAKISDSLSKRELDVLRLLAKGQSNVGIATELHISEFTVKRHVENILRKLDVPTRAAAAAFAVRAGFS